MILQKIVRDNAPLLKKRKKELPISALEEMISKQKKALDFASSLKGEEVSIIAEIKKASPSEGVLRCGFDHIAIARDYCAAGVNAMSVLTEQLHFEGNIEFIRGIKKALPDSNVPILRKDFIIDPYQVYEARAYGTDCMLLITALLSLEEIEGLLALSHSLGMKCLLEVHTMKELELALKSRAEIIGINNRDLESFKVDLSVTETLCKYIPKGKIIVSESGIKTASDVKRVKECGVNAVLVGGALMKASDIKTKLRELKA